MSETHRQCKDCMAWVPKDWHPSRHDCPPFLKLAVWQRRKAIWMAKATAHMDTPEIRKEASDTFDKENPI